MQEEEEGGGGGGGFAPRLLYPQRPPHPPQPAAAGVLQLDEFIDFCRFQVIALYFSNQDRTEIDDEAAKKELRGLKRRQPFMIPIYPTR